LYNEYLVKGNSLQAPVTEMYVHTIVRANNWKHKSGYL